MDGLTDAAHPGAAAAVPSRLVLEVGRPRPATARAALAVLVAAWAAAVHASDPPPQGSTATPPSPGAGGSAPRVADVVLQMPPGESGAGLERYVAVVRGEPLDRRAVRRTIQSLYATGRCGNVVARTRRAGDASDDVVVVVECQPRRVVAAIRIVDASRRPALDDAALRRALALAVGDELWEGRLDGALDRVREAYARHGFRNALVRGVAVGDPRAEIELDVDQGRPTLVEAVQIGGVEHSGDQRWAEALGTRPGAVLDLDVLERDVRELRARLRRERYLRARVGAPVVSVREERARVGAPVVSVREERARVSLPVESGPRFEFRFVGAVAFSAAELRNQLGLETEQVLDAAAIEALAGRLRAFYRARGYAAATVSAGELGAGARVAVVFHVDEGRLYRVRSVTFPGASQRSESWVKSRFEDALAALAPRGSTDQSDGDAERLVKASGSPAAVRSRAPVDPREVWNPPVWDQAAARVVELYRAEGFLDAAHEGTRVVVDAQAGTVDAQVRLREGVQTRIESIAFEGNDHLAAAQLEHELRIAIGDPLAYGAVEASREAMLALYARRGYLYARINDAEELSADRLQARLRFRIEEGPEVRVGNIVVRGARRTREEVVREMLALHPGDVYDPDAAARSQTALLRLGVFRSVGLGPADPDVPDATKDVTVDVAERPWRTLAPGVGFSLADGPRAFVELVQPNLFGRALELTARTKVNYPLTTFRPDLVGKPYFERVEGRGEVGLHDPRFQLFGTQVVARVDAIIERLHRLAYDLGRGSTVFGLDVPVTGRITLSLQYEIEVDHIQKSAALAGINLTLADVERLRFPEGFTTLNSVRPVLTIDFRDNALHPRKGFLATSTVDYVHSIGSSNEGFLFGLVQGSDVFTHMLKVSGAVTGYVPIATQSVFALSVRAGRIVPLDSASQTIGPKRFFLGGASTMRGYEADEMIPQDDRAAYSAEIRNCASSLSGVACTPTAQLAQTQMLVSEGGEAFVLAKAELRIPVRGSLEAGVFVDAGNLWVDPSLMNFTELRFNAGFGLRFGTPIGPAVLDIGFNLAPDQRIGERVVAPQFSIGLF